MPRARGAPVASRLDSCRHGVWRSLVAHSLWERGAVGSNPATPTRATRSSDPPTEETSALKSTVETLSPTRVRLAVEVPFDELKPSLDKAYANIAKQVRVPGFRPGKAPARIIDQRVGRAAVLDEAVQDAVPRAYTEAVRDNELRALGQPDIELTK